jgi:hypothetical protein
MAQRLTDRAVKSLPAPEAGNKVYYDDLVRGFGLRVTTAGARSFVLDYRRRSDRLQRYDSPRILHIEAMPTVGRRKHPFRFHRRPLAQLQQQLLRPRRSTAPDVRFSVLSSPPACSKPRPRGRSHSTAPVACRRAKISGARVHDLRHTYASVLASAGLSLPIIGQLLGHATPTTTARYSHLFDDPLRQATQRAGAIITGKPAAEPIPLKRERG